MDVSETDTEGGDQTTAIVWTVVLSVIYLIGLFLNIRIILISKKEKDITWKIDIAHSVLLIIHYLVSIVMETVTYTIPNLHIYTGEWFCYFYLYIKLYGVISVTCHSTVVSIMKYLIIVRNFGNENTTQIIFWCNPLYPVVFATLSMLRPGFDGFLAVNSCFGGTYTATSRFNQSYSSFQRFFLCGAYDDTHEYFLSYFIYIVSQVYCVLQASVSYAIGLNILDFYLYYKIFSYMRR